ncbi:HTH_Tnp_Tc3_2 domain-containing protein [Trichonephila clavipes]|nr:HTH_Tnp_Tc3_2 domain-containing protein [Trichonephila clavipes]
MQRDCALRIAGRGRLTSFSVEYETGNQSLFECAESFTMEELRRVARQLGHSDCVVRRCWDQWIREMSFTRRLGSGRPRQNSRREDRHIGPPVSSRTIRRRLAEGHLGSRRSLRVLPLTPTHRRLSLKWCAAHEETGLQPNGIRSSLATNHDSISAVMTIVFVCGEPMVDASIPPLLYNDTPLP